MTAIDFRERLLQGLGGPWPTGGDMEAKSLSTEQCDGFTRHKVTYRIQDGETVPAYLLIPDGDNKKRPAVAVWHQHNGAWHLGKVEPAGLAGSPMHHTGVALAKLGYVVLCPDAACFGERQDAKLKGGEFERFLFLKYVVDGKCLAWKNILDMKRAIDFLVQRPEVDPDRIGCYGHSMGSTFTWLVGPWEPRLKCLVGNCCLPTYAAIHRTKILHCFPNFIPGIHSHGDTPDCAALIAPRPLLLNFGETDSGSPIEEVRTGVERIRRAYEAVHAEKNFQAFIEPGVGHILSDEMWRRTKEWFGRHLKA